MGAEAAVMRGRAVVALATAVAGISLATAVVSLGSAGDTVLVSGPNETTSEGFPIGAQVPAISADGRFVAFVGDTPGGSGPGMFLESGTGIYLRDMSGGSTPVDVPSGVGAGGFGLDAGSPSLSSDGRFLAFASEDPALSSENKDVDVTLTGDASPVHNVYVYDRATGHIAFISRRSGARGAAANDDSNLPAISANGRFVAFGTEASNFIHGVFGGVYVRDLHTKTTTLVARQSGAHGKPLRAYNPSISGDGNEVAFVVAVKHPRGTQEIEVRDVRRNRTVLVSRAGGRGGAIASHDCGEPSISANGRYVAFATEAKNISRADDNGVEDVFVRDLEKNRTILVSRSAGNHGAPGNGDSSNPSISAGGRYVAFESYSSNLGPPDNGAIPDVFVRDLRTGHVFLASRASDNGPAANAPSQNPSISASGQFVAFDSRGSNLSPADPLHTSSVFRYQVP
jgi:Tol biopolymer transport system component